MSRKSARMGDVRWIKKTHYTARKKRRKAARLARRRNRESKK